MHEQEQQHNKFKPSAEPTLTLEQAIASTYPDRLNPGVENIDHMRRLPSDSRDALQTPPEVAEEKTAPADQAIDSND